MRSVSALGETLGCEAWDTSLFSSAWGYRNGDLIWSVTHDPDKGPRSLESEGSPPAEFEAVREKLMRDQADHEGEHVDYIFEAPIALTAALCGFRPDRDTVPPETVFKVVEPARSGGAAKRQAAGRALREQLGAGVRDELYPLARELGFESVLSQPDFHKFYPRGASNAFVRHRGEWSESLQVFWGFLGGAPRVELSFFVRRGSEPRYGRSGKAHAPPQRPSWLERFSGRKRDADAASREAIGTGRGLLLELDRYLREGEPHSHIRPPVYWDEAREG
jgi:hypothetical protein